MIPLPGWSLVLLGFGFAPLLATFFFDLWKQPEYQFFPQALAAAAFLAWDRLREVPRPMRGGHMALTAAFLFLSFVLLGLALMFWSPWLAIVSALPAAISILWRIGGPVLLQKMGPALVMVLTVIPPPLGLDQRLGMFLRGLATTMSSRALDLLGVTHFVTGNVIELPGQKLLVEEACSGINSILFVTAFTLFYLFWRRRSLLVILVCLPTALVFVLFGNVVRISLGAWLRFFHGIDILTGWKHEMESVILTAVYLLLVVSLESLFPRGKSGLPTILPPRLEPPPRRRFSPLWFQTACCLFAVLGVLSTFRGWEKWHEKGDGLHAAKSALRSDAVFSLPDRIGDWRRSDIGPPRISKIETLGLSSSIWNYQRPGMQAVLAFDYPIATYHDVSACYEGNGWLIEKKELYIPTTGAPPRFQMRMTKDPGIRATAWFSTINEKGEWVDQATVKHDFFTRLGIFGSQQETTYRVQLLLLENKPMDPVAYEAAAELFEAASAKLSQQMLHQIRQ
ncbi:MAG: exosortase U [Verrucomicrobiota bacterium]